VAEAQASRREFEGRRRLAEQEPDRTKAAQCPDCGRGFATEAGRDEHRAAKHRPQRTARSSKPKPTAARPSRAASPTATEAAKHDDVEIVVPDAELDLYSLPALREELIRLVEEGKTRIILDLSSEALVDDVLNVFRLADTVQGHGGTLALVAPEPVVKVLGITSLDASLSLRHGTTPLQRFPSEVNPDRPGHPIRACCSRIAHGFPQKCPQTPPSIVSRW
jgi:anti-sigma B factor antagonist